MFSKINLNIKVAAIISVFILGSLFISESIPLYSILLFFSLIMTVRYPEFAAAIFLTDSLLLFSFFHYFELKILSMLLINLLLLGIGIILVYFKKKETIRKPWAPLVLVLIMGIMLFIQLRYSPSKEYGLQKSILYFYYNFLFFIIPYYLFPLKTSLDRIYRQGLVIGILLICFSILFLLDHGISDRIDPSGSRNVIWFARSMGLFIFFFYYQFLRSESKISKILSLLLISISLLLINVTGSRGPFIALVASIIIYMFIVYKGNIIKRIALVFGILTSIVGTLIFVLPNILSRFKVISEDPSGILRIYSAFKSWGFIVEHPLFGNGTGSFKSLVNEIIKYPHNIFIEFAMENGIVMVTIFIIFLIYTFYNLLKLRNKLDIYAGKYLYDISILIFLFGFFNAQLSGDIAHNPLMWFAAGTLIYLPKKEI